MPDEAEILDALLQAPEHSISSPLAEDDLAQPEGREQLPQSRIRAARSWLFALGYLGDDEDSGEYDNTLRAAVRQFQADSGLTVDGWIGGEQTWPRLQELVTFETPLDPAFWVRETAEPKLSFKRAAATRLALYGFGGRSETLDDDRLSESIEAFLAVMERLKALPDDMPESIAERIEFILSHDRHVDAVARGQDVPSVVKMFRDAWPRAAAEQAYGLMLNLAKVELWMVQEGDVVLTTNYRGRVTTARDYRLPKVLKNAMSGYVGKIDESGPSVATLKMAFSRAAQQERSSDYVAAFLRIASLNLEASDELSEDDLDHIDGFFNGKHGDLRAAAAHSRLKTSGAMRSRLWDGVRRLWAWLRRAVLRALSAGRKALRLAKRIARFAYRSASLGYAFIAQAISKFTQHVAVVLDRVQSEGKGRVIVRREFGRDMDLVISSDAPTEVSSLFVEKLNTSAGIFARACSILGKAIGFAKRIVSAVLAPPMTLRVLIWAARNARAFMRDVQEIMALQLKHDVLQEALEAS